MFLNRYQNQEREVDVSANGKVFGTVAHGGGPFPYNSLIIEDKVIVQGDLGHTSNAIRWAMPSPDGRHIHMPHGKIVDIFGKEISPEWLSNAETFPTVDPRYFIAVRFIEKNRDDWHTRLDLCTSSDLRIVHSNMQLTELSPK